MAELLAPVDQESWSVPIVVQQRNQRYVGAIYRGDPARSCHCISTIVLRPEGFKSKHQVIKFLLDESQEYENKKINPRNR